MSKTVEDIGTLKINLLSQAQYDAEKAGGRLADDELYLTPSSGTGVSDVEVNGSSVVSGGVAEIELKTINQNSIVGSGDIEIQGGASAFIAEYDTTTYVEVKSAYDDDAVIICMVRDNDNVWVLQLTYYDDINDMFMFAEPYGQGCYWASVASDDTWNDGSFSFASTATATTSSNGLMSSSDKTKLNGIASGAEVNVQSNWSQSDSTADDYIKNKPTIPTITDTYSGTSSNGMSGKAVKSAIDALDGTISGSAGAGKTLTAFSQTDGKVSATFGNISITKSQVSDFPAIPTITDTYSGTSSDGMSGKAVKSAIDALDGTVSGSAGAGKTLTAFSQTDGKVSATFSNISITKSQVSDFPTIPTVNNATLTIQKNGTTVNTFTANASSNVTANITVPTDTGDLTNGAGFITGVTSTSTPTASTIAEFDASAHMNSTDMTSAEVSDFVDDLNVSPINLIDMFYPVGSYYETSDSTFNPNITWGGTWSREDWLSTDEYDITTVFNTDQFSNTTYTATRSGFILFSVLSSARNYVSMLLNSVNIIDTCASSATASTSEVHEVIIPMKVGDVLSVNGLSSTCWIASTRNKFFAYKIIGNRWHRTA